MKEPEVLSEYPNGMKRKDFDPVDAYDDASDVGEGITVVQRKKGYDYKFAERKSEKRLESIMARSGYHEYIPCIKCTACVIIRAMEHGEIKNKFYACQKYKVRVSRYGTCIMANEGNGPLVIEKDLTMEEIMANKDKLIN